MRCAKSVDITKSVKSSSWPNVKLETVDFVLMTDNPKFSPQFCRCMDLPPG